MPSCPTCGSRTKQLTVHDDTPFTYHECAECGWDDYDEAAINAAVPDDSELTPLIFNDDEYGDEHYEPDEDC